MQCILFFLRLLDPEKYNRGGPWKFSKSAWVLLIQRQKFKCFELFKVLDIRQPWNLLFSEIKELNNSILENIQSLIKIFWGIQIVDPLAHWGLVLGLALCCPRGRHTQLLLAPWVQNLNQAGYSLLPGALTALSLAAPSRDFKSVFPTEQLCLWFNSVLPDTQNISIINCRVLLHTDICKIIWDLDILEWLC